MNQVATAWAWSVTKTKTHESASFLTLRELPYTDAFFYKNPVIISFSKQLDYFCSGLVDLTP